MAYGLIYTSHNYNRVGDGFNLYIYKQDYTGDVENIITSDYELTYNNNENIISLSLDITLINDKSFDYYDDLLKNHEREYKVLLQDDGGTTLFEGYLICDIIEQELLNNSTINLTFTDYIKRLQDITLDDYLEFGRKRYLIDILVHILSLTSLDYPIYINSNLYPYGASRANGTTFYERVKYSDDIFFSSQEQTEDAYSILNNLLNFSKSYLYMYKGAWYIERYDDVSNDTRFWAYFSPGNTTNQITTNKCNKITHNVDFQYLNQSQTIPYESGLKMYEIKLDDNNFDNLIINNFYSGLTRCDRYCETTDLDLRKWYVAESSYNKKFGRNYYSINNYIGWENLYSTQPGWEDFTKFDGIYVRFQFSWNEGGTENPTALNIKYKMYAPDISSYGYKQRYIGRFWIMNKTGFQDSWLYSNNGEFAYLEGAPSNPYVWTVKIDNTDEIINSKIVEIEKTFDLTHLSGYTSGYDQDYILGIMPLAYQTTELTDIIDNAPIIYNPYNYAGDVSINVSAKLMDNIIEYSVEDNFIKSKSDTIRLFDVENLNLKNGLFYNNERTKNWTDNNGSSYDSIVNHLASSTMAYYSQTRLGLNANIEIYDMIKPLSIIYDNQLKNGGNNIPFILNNYTYDLFNGEMNINCKEYGTETINIIES